MFLTDTMHQPREFHGYFLTASSMRSKIMARSALWVAKRLREVGQYAVAVVGLSAAVNFGLVTVLADYDPTLIKIVAVAAAAVPAALVAWFVSTRVLHIGAPAEPRQPLVGNRARR